MPAGLEGVGPEGAAVGGRCRARAVAAAAGLDAACTGVTATRGIGAARR